ncbi:MAG: hypothetical protein ACOCPT_00925 [Halanaeroarchaeum sp.]
MGTFTDYQFLSISMNRRRYLALAGLGIGAVGGYTGWRWYRAPSVPDGMSVQPRHFERDILTEQTSRSSDFLEWKSEYQTVISDPETADRVLIDDRSITRFLDDTDFEASYLIVVQNGMQSEMELELDSITRREDGLHLDISIDPPQSGPDDLGIHSLLIRITDETGDVPDDVSVTITGYV